MIPLGLTNIATSSSNWHITLTSNTSPALLQAIYTGPYPINPGEGLPEIVITGTLTTDALPSLTNLAKVSVNGDTNLTNNIVTNSVQVAPGTPTAPDLAVVQSPSSATAQVGQPISFSVEVGNIAGTLSGNNGSVIVNDILPIGLSNITAQGSNWTFFTTSNTGPALLSGIYTGPLPLTAGESLPTITVTGTINPDADGTLSNTVIVSDAGDSNLSNNQSVSSVEIVAPTPTVIPTATP